MKYILLIYDAEKDWATRAKDERDKLGAEYGSFTESIRKSGHFVAGEPLKPVATATTVRVRGGKTQTSTFTAGKGGSPFNLTLQNVLASGLPAYTNISPASFQTTLHATDLTFVNTYQAMKPTLRAPARTSRWLPRWPWCRAPWLPRTSSLWRA